MIVDGIDHQALQDALHLDFNFIEQFGEFARFNEFGNVVVGMEAFFRRFHAFTDFHRHRNAFRVGVCFRGLRICFHKHGQ